MGTSFATILSIVTVASSGAAAIAGAMKLRRDKKTSAFGEMRDLSMERRADLDRALARIATLEDDLRDEAQKAFSLTERAAALRADLARCHEVVSALMARTRRPSNE